MTAVRRRDRTALHCYDNPTMGVENTSYLRKLIERRTAKYMWGQLRFVTPRVCGEVFGDGRKLIGLSPIMFRPNYFVVRIDSAWSTSNWDRTGATLLIDNIDDVYTSLEEEYEEWPWSRMFGLKRTDDWDDERSSHINFNDGCEWWEMCWPSLQAATRGE